MHLLFRLSLSLWSDPPRCTRQLSVPDAQTHFLTLHFSFCQPPSSRFVDQMLPLHLRIISLRHYSTLCWQSCIFPLSAHLYSFSLLHKSLLLPFSGDNAFLWLTLCLNHFLFPLFCNDLTDEELMTNDESYFNFIFFILYP